MDRVSVSQVGHTHEIECSLHIAPTIDECRLYTSECIEKDFPVTRKWDPKRCRAGIGDESIGRSSLIYDIPDSRLREIESTFHKASRKYDILDCHRERCIEDEEDFFSGIAHWEKYREK